MHVSAADIPAARICSNDTLTSEIDLYQNFCKTTIGEVATGHNQPEWQRRRKSLKNEGKNTMPRTDGATVQFS